MYSYEIDELMKMRNYLLYVEDYLKIIENSNQINYIKYHDDNDYFEINTDDNYNWKFKVNIRKRELNK